MKRMSDTAPIAGGASQNWVTLAAMILVGALALVSLYMGFRAYGDNEIETAFMYLLVGASGFIAIGYSFFRAKPTAKESLEPKKSDVITTLECPQCNLKRVRSFQRGDYIFKRDEPCSRCEGQMVITAIHTRKEEKK
jgi:rubredoxin